ncbi:hypothetical protein JCM11672_21350 [Alkaliphilus crotonatoxidans]
MLLICQSLAGLQFFIAIDMKYELFFIKKNYMKVPIALLKLNRGQNKGINRDLLNNILYCVIFSLYSYLLCTLIIVNFINFWDYTD